MSSYAARVEGDLRVEGNLYVDGDMPETPRTQLTQDVLAKFAVPLTDLRVWDAIGSLLPSAGANDDLGLYSGTFGTDAPKVSTGDLTDLSVQDALREGVDELRRAGEENVEAIRMWRGALGPEPWHHRVHDAIRATESTVEAIASDITNRYLY